MSTYRNSSRAMKHFDPFDGFLDVETSFEKARRDLFNNFFSDPKYIGNLAKSGSYPKLDIVEKKDRVEISVAIPGLKREDVDIGYEKGTLTISSNRISQEEDADSKFVWRELHRSRFSRTVLLSEEHLDTDNISATMSGGILLITINKKLIYEKETVKKIEIK